MLIIIYFIFRVVLTMASFICRSAFKNSLFPNLFLNWHPILSFFIWSFPNIHDACQTVCFVRILLFLFLVKRLNVQVGLVGQEVCIRQERQLAG
jgi:hypothetical protein